MMEVKVKEGYVNNISVKVEEGEEWSEPLVKKVKCVKAKPIVYSSRDRGKSAVSEVISDISKKKGTKEI